MSSARGMAIGAAIGGAIGFVIGGIAELITYKVQYMHDVNNKDCELAVNFAKENNCDWRYSSSGYASFSLSALEPHACIAFTECEDGAEFNSEAVFQNATAYAKSQISEHLKTTLPATIGALSAFGIVTGACIGGWCGKFRPESSQDEIKQVTIAPKSQEIDLEQGIARPAETKAAPTTTQILTDSGAGVGLWREPQREAAAVVSEQKAQIRCGQS